MRLLVPSVVALVYLCLAALLPASSAFKGPLKPRNELDRPRLHNVAVPAAGPDDYAPGPGHYDDYAAGPYAYGPEQYDYDYEFTLSPIVEAPGAAPLSFAAFTTYIPSICLKLRPKSTHFRT